MRKSCTFPLVVPNILNSGLNWLIPPSRLNQSINQKKPEKSFAKNYHPLHPRGWHSYVTTNRIENTLDHSLETTNKDAALRKNQKAHHLGTTIKNVGHLLWHYFHFDEGQHISVSLIAFSNSTNSESSWIDSNGGRWAYFLPYWFCFPCSTPFTKTKFLESKRSESWLCTHPPSWYR